MKRTSPALLLAAGALWLLACQESPAEKPASARASSTTARQQPQPQGKPVAQQAPGGILPEGAAFPDLTLKDQDGNALPLAKLKGKKALIWFYPKAATGG